MRRIAALARLELTAAEIETFAEQLSAILAYAGTVQEVDTSGIAQSPNGDVRKAAAHTPDSAGLPFRSDDLAPSLPRDVVLEQAPDADRSAGVFKVPRVLGS